MVGYVGYWSIDQIFDETLSHPLQRDTETFVRQALRNFVYYISFEFSSFQIAYFRLLARSTLIH